MREGQGGGILFNGLDRVIVYPHIQGSCSDCPTSTVTPMAGIDSEPRNFRLEIIEVGAV